MKKIKFTTYNNLKVRYSIEGIGTSVVLLHGFLESLAIFSEFTNDLAKHFQVICIDIPGHGKSQVNSNNSMEYIADTVNFVLAELRIEKFFIFGHSMGGYATLAFVEKYPAVVKAFYMKRDPLDPNYVLNADLLAPEGYGEIIGGSQREDDYEVLLARIKEHHLPLEAFHWYLDTRKYGSVPHSGFGYGLERIVAWVCGVPHIRETIPFPRMITRLTP